MINLRRRALASMWMTLCICIAPGISGADADARQADAPGRRNLIVEVGGGVTMEFVLVQPGTFIMGSNRSPLLDQKPERSVTIAEPFYLGKYEVTQEQWQAVMNNTPGIHKGPKFPNSAKYPVENVSWNYCQSFLARLNERSATFQFRLPTEAEWEYACRAGATNDCTGDAEAAAHAWFSANANGQPHPVGTKLPNAWGLHDMQGNVWEWCADIYQAYPGGTLPGGVGSGTSRVLRGGAYNSLPERLSPAYRHDLEPDDSFRYYGFRCVVAIKRTPQ